MNAGITRNRNSTVVLSVCILAFLMFWFGRYIQTNSYDLLQHFLLVDEIMKHGGVRPPPLPVIPMMAYYPPASHWMAAIVGWIGGSGLVGITLVSIASVFISYLLIARLVGIDSPLGILLFTALFFAAQFTRSQIGWELVGNFFYPQMVADVAYFAVLLWLARSRANWEQAGIVLLGGVLTMWIQPLLAVHILAVGCFLMLMQVIERWKDKDLRLMATIAWLAVIAAASVAIILFHPAFKFMRNIAANDGYLEFGYPHVMGIVTLFGLLGLFNIWRRLTGRAEHVDGVLGCALIAAVFLAMAQFAILKLHGTGSGYAIKKHMFVLVTLGIMNATRAVMGYSNVSEGTAAKLRFLEPVAAGVMSFFVLLAFNVPVAPVLKAMDYAEDAANFHLPDARPGDVVSDDRDIPQIANVMITMAAFQYPNNERSGTWAFGKNIMEGAKFSMTKRASGAAHSCNKTLAESGDYIITSPSCLKQYALNEPISFAAGGNGWQYQNNGWGSAEPWGTWAIGNQDAAVDIEMPQDSKGPFRLTLDGLAFVTPKHPSQAVEVEVNGTKVATWNFNVKADRGQRTADIPKSLAQDGALHIVFRTPGAVSPADMGAGPDIRVLGLGVGSITLTD